PSEEPAGAKAAEVFEGDADTSGTAGEIVAPAVSDGDTEPSEEPAGAKAAEVFEGDADTFGTAVKIVAPAVSDGDTEPSKDPDGAEITVVTERDADVSAAVELVALAVNDGDTEPPEEPDGANTAVIIEGDADASVAVEILAPAVSDGDGDAEPSEEPDGAGTAVVIKRDTDATAAADEVGTPADSDRDSTAPEAVGEPRESTGAEDDVNLSAAADDVVLSTPIKDDTELLAAVDAIGASAEAERMTSVAVDETNSVAVREGDADLPAAVDGISASEVAVGIAGATATAEELKTDVDREEAVEAPTGTDGDAAVGSDIDTVSDEAVAGIITIACDEDFAELSAVGGEVGASVDDAGLFMIVEAAVAVIVAVSDGDSSVASSTVFAPAVVESDADFSVTVGDNDNSAGIGEKGDETVTANVVGDPAIIEDEADISAAVGETVAPAVDNGSDAEPSEEPDGVINTVVSEEGADALGAVGEIDAPAVSDSDAELSDKPNGAEVDLNLFAVADDVVASVPIKDDVDPSATTDADGTPTESEALAAVIAEDIILDAVTEGNDDFSAEVDEIIVSAGITDDMAVVFDGDSDLYVADEVKVSLEAGAEANTVDSNARRDGDPEILSAMEDVAMPAVFVNVVKFSVMADETRTSPLVVGKADASAALDVTEARVVSERDAESSTAVEEARTFTRGEDCTALSVAVKELGDSAGIAGIVRGADFSVAVDEVGIPIVGVGDARILVVVNDDDTTGDVTDVLAGDCDTPAVIEEDANVSGVLDVNVSEPSDEISATADEVEAFADIVDEAVLSPEPNAVETPREGDTDAPAVVDAVGSPAVLASDADWSAATDEVDASICAVAEVDIAMIVEVDSSADAALDFGSSTAVGVDFSIDAVCADADVDRPAGTAGDVKVSASVDLGISADSVDNVDVSVGVEVTNDPSVSDAVVATESVVLASGVAEESKVEVGPNNGVGEVPQ
ncbi:hypothetical protein BGZ70_006237, partial [Mortierella alpina]